MDERITDEDDPSGSLSVLDLEVELLLLFY